MINEKFFYVWTHTVAIRYFCLEWGQSDVCMSETWPEGILFSCGKFEFMNFLHPPFYKTFLWQRRTQHFSWAPPPLACICNCGWSFLLRCQPKRNFFSHGNESDTLQNYLCVLIERKMPQINVNCVYFWIIWRYKAL